LVAGPLPPALERRRAPDERGLGDPIRS